MLIHIKNVLSADEVAHCRKVLEASQWVNGADSSGSQARQVKHNLQVPPDAREALELGDIILRALGRNALFNTFALPLRVLPPMFNRYDVGMSFGFHVDGAIRAHPAVPRMRADVSSTLFLSGPDEYDGGELVIQDTYGAHAAKLPAGDMIVYPTTSLHAVNPITRGSRWASFFWSQSMVKDEGERTILYEMDVAIMRLRQELPDDHPSVLSLLNTYNNLLRLWAEM